MGLRSRLGFTLFRQFLLLLLVSCLSFVVMGILGLAYYQRLNSNQNPSAKALDILRDLPSETKISSQKVTVSPKTLATISNHHGWLQVLDENGDMIFGYHVPSNLSSHYSPGKLLYLHNDPSKKGYRMFVWYSKINGKSLTWIYGVPFTDKSSFNLTFLIIAMVFSSIISTLVISFVLGTRLSSPLLHILDWLHEVSHKNYKEPKDSRGVSKSQMPSGKLRRRFLPYKEIVMAMENLVQDLKQSDEERRRLEATREEWMTGISHDLKTPLSTIKGYSELLSMPQYQWEKNEIKSLALRC